MAEPLDVAARLAEGRPAVDNVGDYVWACHQLGYQNPDLTLHAAQVRDWYSSEDGLDLRALDTDRAEMDAVVAAIDRAIELQRRQLTALTGAWRGLGGNASHDFLLRHGEASAAAASAVRRAVDALGALRDELWHAVDEKVATTVAIDERPQAQRAEWLTAAHTVSSGSGDRAAASELVDQRVKPFVDNDIRADWLTAMQKAMSSVSGAFDTAIRALTSEPQAAFEVPGDLGPPPIPSPTPSAPAVEAAGTTPAAWPSPPPTVTQAPAPMPAPAFAAPEPPAATAVAPVPPAAPASASLPPMPSFGDPGGGLSSGGGLPSATGGFGDLGTRIADAIGGLLDRPEDGRNGLPQLQDEPLRQDSPGIDVDEERRGDEDDEDEPGPDDPDDPDEEAVTDEIVDKTDEACPAQEEGREEGTVEATPPADPVATPPPAPLPPPPQPIVEPAPTAEPLGAETPCEIAADELPQAGP